MIDDKADLHFILKYDMTLTIVGEDNVLHSCERRDGRNCCYENQIVFQFQIVT